MGRGWTEEKQIGEELQREGSTERGGGGRGGRGWGGRDGRAVREEKQAGERRIGMQKEPWEGESTEGGRKRREGKWGCRGGGGQAARAKRTPGADRGEERLKPESEEAGDCARREAGACSRVRQLLASIQTPKTRGLCLTSRVGNRRPVFVESGTPPREWDCSGLGPAPGTSRGFAGPGLAPEGSKRPAWRLGPRKGGTTTTRSQSAVGCRGARREPSLWGRGAGGLRRRFPPPGAARSRDRGGDRRGPRARAASRGRGGPSFGQCEGDSGAVDAPGLLAAPRPRPPSPARRSRPAVLTPPGNPARVPRGRCVSQPHRHTAAPLPYTSWPHHQPLRPPSAPLLSSPLPSPPLPSRRGAGGGVAGPEFVWLHPAPCTRSPREEPGPGRCPAAPRPSRPALPPLWETLPLARHGYS